MSTVLSGHEVQLASRPDGVPTPENFRLVEVAVPAPGPGQVLVRNLFMSVDPYMRGRMNDARSYIAPFQVDCALDGHAVGEVLTSDSPELHPGDVVLHNLGWREYAVGVARWFRRVDPDAAPSVSAYLGVLGMPGLTAYAGVLDVAAMQPGETVFVSAAAGAVGSVAGQVARLRGAARVVGSAGSAAKVAHLAELGFDAGFDYHDGDVRDQLRRAAPEGIDVYFDNVGGDHLVAAIAAMRPFGRVAMCGAISQYNQAQASGPRNLSTAIGKQLTLRGYLVGNFEHLRPEFEREVGGWLARGELRHDETVVDGLENAPEAFLALLRGENVGKMVVRLH